MLPLSFYTTAYFITAVLSLMMAVIVVNGGGWKDKFSRLYGLLNIAIAFWALGRYIVLISTNHNTALLWTHLFYFGSILIYVLFLHSIYVFLEASLKKKIILGICYGLAAVLVVANTVDMLSGARLFIADVVPKLIFSFYEIPGPLYVIQLLLNLLIPILAIAEMVFGYIRITDKTKKEQVKYILISSLVGFMGGGTILLLVYNIPVPPYGVPLVTIQFAVITYAITKHRLFNIKVIAAEIFVLLLWGAIFARFLLLRSPADEVFNVILLVLAGIFGALLIKAVINDVLARERLQAVAEKVDTTNKRLEQIEQQKADFISIASHQLRTPLTAIKGYTSMLLEGSFGAVVKPVSETLQKMFISSQKLVALVEDLLTVSRIERGKIVYNFSPTNVLEVVRTATKEKMPEIEDRKLGLVVQAEHDDDTYLVNGDAEKMKQIFVNIIDNAVKYTAKGLIRIYVSRDELKDRIRVSISDTGVGMEKRVIDTLFMDPEQRIRAAGDKQTVVNGIGMYVANQMVKAHQGSIWADSDGPGRGATFFVEFPAVG